MNTKGRIQRTKSNRPLTTDGIILVDKEPGLSSFEIVEKIKDLVKAEKVGHAGTLDPLATGVLIVLLNQGTKLSPFLMSHDKVYKGSLKLGIETDTQDFTGRIIHIKDIERVTYTMIKHVAGRFIGAIKQVPPSYSAVHHNGRRAYELARDGIAVDLPPKDVRIDYIRILSIDLPIIWFEVGCSSGTYIRTLAADLGKSLGVGAHLTSLRRVQSGPFHVDDALTLIQIAHHLSTHRIHEAIIPSKQALPEMMEVEIPSELAQKIRNGYQPDKKELSPGKNISLRLHEYVKAITGEELVAILKKNEERYTIVRVFIGGK
jgi:tRNA pseudouridine55 synthase